MSRFPSLVGWFPMLFGAAIGCDTPDPFAGAWEGAATCQFYGDGPTDEDLRLELLPVDRFGLYDGEWTIGENASELDCFAKDDETMLCRYDWATEFALRVHGEWAELEDYQGFDGRDCPVRLRRE